MWIGHATGTADLGTSDKDGNIMVPPEKPEYLLKRVFLSRDEEEGFYYGFSNEGIWPLCHIAHERPIFRRNDWHQYVEVNAKFASVFSEEMKSARPVALIQDYHFALMPTMIRKMRPDALTALFWHPPFPNPEALRICPWRKDLLHGMLGADLIGFQVPYHANNFLDAVDRFLEARVSRDHMSVTIQGHTCYIRSLPISVECPPRHRAGASEFGMIRAQLLEELALPQDVKLGIGVDRLDYTKGIIERLRAVERFLELHPEYVGKFSFVQICSPDKMHIKRYQELYSEIQKVADSVNWRFYSAHCPPVVLKMTHHSREEIFRYYRACDFLFVGSLHDGMNLVAKEFVASRADNRGVLILSEFHRRSAAI